MGARVVPASGSRRPPHHGFLIPGRFLLVGRVSTVIHCLSLLQEASSDLDFWPFVFIHLTFGFWLIRPLVPCQRAHLFQGNFRSSKYSVRKVKGPPGSPKSHQSRCRTATFFFLFVFFSSHITSVASLSGRKSNTDLTQFANRKSLQIRLQLRLTL